MVLRRPTYIQANRLLLKLMNLVLSFIDTLVPGTRKTYQEILVEGLRDYSIEKQIHHTKVTWSNVVGFIRVIKGSPF